MGQAKQRKTEIAQLKAGGSCQVMWLDEQHDVIVAATVEISWLNTFTNFSKDDGLAVLLSYFDKAAPTALDNEMAMAAAAIAIKHYHGLKAGTNYILFTATEGNKFGPVRSMHGVSDETFNRYVELANV
jgi:hypothetical protein